MSESRPTYRVDILSIPDIAEAIARCAKSWSFSKDHLLNLIYASIIESGGDFWDPISIRAAIHNLQILAITMKLPPTLGSPQEPLPIDPPPRRGKGHLKFAPGQIRNKSQVVNYSRLILGALEEVLEYNPAKHHNSPPPDLRLENLD